MTPTISDTDTLRTYISNRLQDLCSERYGGSATRMAEALGVSQSRLSRLLRVEQTSVDAI